MIRSIIVFTIANYPLTFLVLGLILAQVQIALAPRPLAGGIAVEKLLA